MSMIYLFTTPSCPNCPRAKALLREKNLNFQVIDASQKEGLALAKKYGFSSVPSMLTTDEDGKVQHRLSGLESITAYFSA